MRTLAKEFGISDVGLAKLCRRHSIPLPGRGHWVRLQFGKKSERTPLPANTSVNETITIAVTEPRPYENSLQKEQMPSLVIEVADDRPITHPLALKTKRLFNRSRKGIRDVLIPKEGQASHLAVTEGTLPRALRVLDALFVAVESQQHLVVWQKEPASRLHLLVEGEQIQFRLSEAFDQKAHTPTQEEITRKKQWNLDSPKWDHVPSGRLRLSFENLPYGLKAVRKTWADRRNRRLEARLGEFVANLKLVARALKLDREETERRRKEWEEQRKREEEERREYQEYLRKLEVLRTFQKEWQESRSLARFAEAFATALEQRAIPEEIRSGLEPIAQWAGRVAAATNPLSQLEEIHKKFFPPPGSWWT